MATDEDLMGGVAAGNADALAALCARWQEPLHQFLYRYGGGRDAEDLQQETWMRVVRSARQFDRTRRFSTWLFQIALNLTRDWHRHPPPDVADAAAIPDAPDARATLAPAEAGIDVRRLLAALSPEHRAVIVLRYYHDLSEDEVAEIVGCPRGTVKSRLHHAMAKLSALAKEAST